VTQRDGGNESDEEQKEENREYPFPPFRHPYSPCQCNCCLLCCGF